MKQKHKFFIRRLANFTFDGEPGILLDRVKVIVRYFYQRFPRYAKVFIAYYIFCLGRVYAERYVQLFFVGQLQDQQRQMIRKIKMFASRKWEEEIHPELLGGFKIQWNDNVYDVSLKGELEEIVRALK